MFDLTLTFDNGPDPETTPFVLDVLARRSLRTTFFVVGHKLSTLEGRRLARRAHEEGHWIGNHTWRHSVPVCTENLVRFDLMTESLNVGRDGRADILPLEPGRVVVQA
jgi:hypothetical protein